MGTLILRPKESLVQNAYQYFRVLVLDTREGHLSNIPGVKVKLSFMRLPQISLSSLNRLAANLAHDAAVGYLLALLKCTSHQ